MIVIINFSGRDFGNCRSIAYAIKTWYKQDEVRIVNFRQLKTQPCGQCQYQCFKENEKCPISDNIDDIYNLVVHSTLAIYLIPNYCDYPNANFFIFNERGCGYFNKDIDLLNKYLAIKKKFIVISNTNTEHFSEILNYQVENGQADILFLSAKKYQKLSLLGDLINDEKVQEEIKMFLK